ncbi:MAG TPA: lactate racemase domain-containing protein [bacterium]|nr:lactate racemase domain-containing protein [bacterium]HOL48430.1 lactate racemase domain-containing protein [bacterium]HPQ18672.1 lactate racemase domain-containing protein [bacterium]
MKTINLKFGQSNITINIPDKNFNGIIEPDNTSSILQNDVYNSDNNLIIQNEINDWDKYKEILNNKKILILTEDDTRNVPHIYLFSNVIKKILNISQPQFIKVIIATGSHNPQSTGNLKLKNEYEEILEKEKFKNYKIIIHNCFNSQFTYYGKTAYNNDIYLNSEIDDTETFIILSDVKVHYFAGYSNFVKYFVPGCAAFKTIEKNHSLALDEFSTFARHPLHYDKSRQNNKLANDMYEAYKLATKNKNVILISCVSLDKKIIYIKSGKPEEIMPDCFKFVDNHFIKKIMPVNRIIICPGGFPEDESLYNAQRSLELTKEGIAENAEILFIAACENGIAPNEEAMKNFFYKLQDDLDNVLNLIENDYHLYEHKAYKFAKLLKNTKIYMYSKLDAELLKSIHLIPVNEPQTIVNNWIKNDSDIKITIFNYANKLSIIKK